MAFSVVLSFSLIWRRVPLTEGRNPHHYPLFSRTSYYWISLATLRSAILIPKLNSTQSTMGYDNVLIDITAAINRMRVAGCIMTVYRVIPAGGVTRKLPRSREILTAFQRMEFSNRKDWPDVNYMDVVDIWFLTSPATPKSSLSIVSLWMPTGFCNMAGWGKFCTWSSRVITWHALR